MAHDLQDVGGAAMSAETTHAAPHFLHELCVRCAAVLTPEQRASGARVCPDGCGTRAWVTLATDVPKIGSGPWGQREAWQ